MVKNDIPAAESLLKAHLRQKPTDAPAIRMLAEIAVRIGRDEDAENLLERCLELAPGFGAARYNYAVLLHRRNQPKAAKIQNLGVNRGGYGGCYWNEKVGTRDP